MKKTTFKLNTTFLSAAAVLLLTGCQTFNDYNTDSAENTDENAVVSDQFVPQGSLLAQGAYYDKIGDHQVAQRLYRQALVENPNDINIRNNMGLSLLLSGDKEGASSVLQSVVNDPAATTQHRNNLALVYGLMGRDNAARLLLQQDLSPSQVAQNMGLYSSLRRNPEKIQQLLVPAQAPAAGNAGSNGGMSRY